MEGGFLVFVRKKSCINIVCRAALLIMMGTILFFNSFYSYASPEKQNKVDEVAEEDTNSEFSDDEVQGDLDSENEKNSAEIDYKDGQIPTDSEEGEEDTLENGQNATEDKTLEIQNEQLLQDEENDMKNLALQNASVLADGEYVIGSQLSKRQVIDVASGSDRDGANVQMYESNMTDAQKWRVIHDEEGFVTFINVGSGKALDVTCGYSIPGTNVQQYTLNESKAQKWIVLLNDDGTYTIKSAIGQGLVLNIAGMTAGNSSNVEISSENGSDNQKFFCYSTQINVSSSGQTIDDGTYLISSNGFVLENIGNQVEGNINKRDVLEQCFYISYDESKGFYLIESCSTEKMVEAEKGSIVPGTPVILSSKKNISRQQYWDIALNEDQSVTITNVANGQVLGQDQKGEKSYAITVSTNDTRKCAWTLEQASIHWSESEMDNYAALKKEQPDMSAGIYQITSMLNERMSLDVANGSSNNAAKIQLYESNETNAQRWKVEYLDDGYVKMTSMVSGKVLDVACASKENGVQMQQYEWNKSRAQKWLPVKNDNGTYTFYSALGHGLVLDVASGIAVNGAKVQTYGWNSSAAQMFWLFNTEIDIPSQGKVIENGYYSIALQENDKLVLDLRNGDTANGTPMQIYSSNGTLAQCFWVEYMEDGYYSIKIAKTGKHLDLKRGGLVPGTIVQQEKEDDKLKQRWVISKNADGSYRIISAANGLSVDAGDISLGNTITTQHTSDISSQKWNFIEYKPSVAEGCYKISTAINSNKVIDIYCGTLAERGNAQIYSYNATLAQKWQVRQVQEGIITLQNVGSGLYLTDVNGNVCQMNNSGESEDSQWVLGLQLGDGFTLTNKASGKRLDLSGANTADSTNVGTCEANGTKAQAWNFSRVNLLETGFYEFAPLSNTGLRLDVANGSRDNYANVQVYSANGTLSQRWWVRSTGDGWFTLTACCSAKLLDISGAYTALKTNIQQFQSNGSNAQKWRFEMGENGIVLKSALGVVADVAGSSGQSGTNVWTYEQNGSAGQEWRVFSADTPGKIGWQNPIGYPQVSSRTVILPGYCTGYFTYVTPSRIAIDASREDCVNAFVARAYEYLGTRYIEPWSSWPGDAVDCSGLVLQCLYATGMDMGIYNPYNHRWLPGQTYNSMNWLNNNTFMPVGLNNLQRGDLVYYRNHVAIYIGGGQIIDSWPGQGVTIQGLYSRGNVIGVQRPFI